MHKKVVKKINCFNKKKIMKFLFVFSVFGESRKLKNIHKKNDKVKNLQRNNES